MPPYCSSKLIQSNSGVNYPFTDCCCATAGQKLSNTRHKKCECMNSVCRGKLTISCSVMFRGLIASEIRPNFLLFVLHVLNWPYMLCVAVYNLICFL